MSSDDIISLRHSYVLSMVERISELEAEVERLTDHNCEVATGYVQLLDHHTATRLERDRLRAAGDALADDVDVALHSYSLGIYHTLAAWREARRG